MPSPLDSPLFSLLHFAREMRKAPTPSEGILWNALRDRRFRGIKFRRQHVAHPYIVDFFAPALKLVVEVDGGYHADRVAEDAARDAELAVHYGVRVVRIDAGLVERDLAGALRVVAEHIA
jgi:very-short-patch-repair endonuclease